jgi:hypothetical protein
MLLHALYMLFAVTAFVLVGILGCLLALYQIRDRLDEIIKLQEKNKE